MGNVKSFCCRDDASDDDDREERTGILNDHCCRSRDDIYHDSLNSDLSNQDNLSYGSINDGNDSKTLEQSALDRIYQRMVINLIDVAPGDSLVIQPAEFIERQKLYQAKLSQLKTPLPLKSNDPSLGASSSSSPSIVGTSHQAHISVEEVQLINDISIKSEQAIKNLKIISGEPIITHFKP